MTLHSLITSKTRVKLLLKFFSNSRTRGYLRELANEFGESTNAVRTELNRMSEAGLLASESNGRKRIYRANADHPLFPELESLTRKYLGLDRVEQVMSNLGDVKLALITGDYARGIDSGMIDLTIVGTVKKEYLSTLVEKVEKLINRRIRTIILSQEEYKELSNKKQMDGALVLWSGNNET